MNFYERNEAIKKTIDEMRLVYQKMFTEYLNYEEKTEQLNKLSELSDKLKELKQKDRML